MNLNNALPTTNCATHFNFRSFPQIREGDSRGIFDPEYNAVNQSLLDHQDFESFALWKFEQCKRYVLTELKTNCIGTKSETETWFGSFTTNNVKSHIFCKKKSFFKE